MLIDLSVFRNNKDFCWMFFGQAISYIGSMVSYVAIPYQVYELTKSSLIVGAVSAVQMAPLLLGLFGGSVADRRDRRQLVMIAELIMCLSSLGLLINATLSSPSVIAIFVFSFVLQAASSYHRPALEAMTQKMVAPKDFPSVAALGSLKFSVAAIIGPALGGFIIHKSGLNVAYGLDFLTFVFSFISFLFVSNTYQVDPPEATDKILLEIKEGLQFALKNQTLLGSYVVDIVAMIFAFPVALFPEIAKHSTEDNYLGPLYAAMAVGSLLVALFSRWTNKDLRRGRSIAISAAFWGVAICLFGITESPWLALGFLALAGAADAVSGLNRRVVWNEVIPNSIRGRMAGIEMISYMSGPLLGNFRAGGVAGFTSVKFSIISGGFICIIGVALCALFLPEFWNYKSRNSHEV